MTTKTRTKTNEEALANFVTAIGEIVTTIDEIKIAADDHFGTHPDEIHWGHVGDANRVLEGLKEIATIIRNDAK